VRRRRDGCEGGRFCESNYLSLHTHCDDDDGGTAVDGSNCSNQPALNHQPQPPDTSGTTTTLSFKYNKTSTRDLYKTGDWLRGDLMFLFLALFCVFFCLRCVCGVCVVCVCDTEKMVEQAGCGAAPTLSAVLPFHARTICKLLRCFEPSID